MDHKKCLANLLLYFGILHYFPRVSSQIEVTVGDTVSIQCRVTGTFTLPEWTFGLVPITNQGSPIINPDFTRLRYASDQKNLILTNAQLNDTGNYVCTHTLGANTTSLNVKETTTTQPENNSCETSCCGVSIAVCFFFVVVILVHTVVIIKCSHILIEEHKRQKADENNGKPKDNDGQNGCIGTEENRIREHKLVWVIIITATVIFIAVSAWFIVMQATDATDEDCEEICECDDDIGLLAFEVVDFVLGVCFVIYLFYNYRDYPTCDQCGGVMILLSSGGDRHPAAIKPPVENNPGPWKPDHPDVSPQHRPQPALPPKERHGSDLSRVSRKDVKLDPIPPIRKNNSTTEFHMDNPESERYNIKVSCRGLSAVFDQEYDQPPTNRLAPIDHTVMAESIRRKKKKKKTRTNNDNVKFDNDYD